MAEPVQPIPAGYHTATPYLIVHDGAQALDFYKRAFDAREVVFMEGPGGKIAHAEFKIGDSKIMLGDEMPGGDVRSPQSLGGTTGGIFLYVKDVDEAYNRAVAAGARSVAPVTDMFWGDRYGKLADPFGHSWSLATHKEDVAPEELKKRSDAFMAKMAASQKAKTA